MNNPLITIAIVTYNSEKYVRTAIESSLASSYTNLEILISDDNSTDTTWNIISSYSDPRLSISRNAKNLGEYGNRNLCIERAKGDLFIFIDGDDYIYPHALDIIVRTIGAERNFGFAVMCPYNTKIIFPAKLSPKDIYLSEFLGKGLINVAFTHTIFSTEVLKHYKLSSDYIAGDTFIRLKIGQAYPCLLINDNLAWWRNTPGQAYEKLECNYFSDFFKMANELFSTEICPLNEEQKRMALSNILILFWKQIFILLKHFQFKKALKIFQLSSFKLATFSFGFKKVKVNDPMDNYSPMRPLTLCKYSF